MIDSRSVLLTFGLAASAVAQNQLAVSIGVRETGFGGGSFTSIGGDGGFSGGIEWVNQDAQTLTLDGTWQTFTFTLATDPITGFAGGSANGVLEGLFGTLEHLRVLNASGVTDPITIWVDDVANTITPGGTTTFGTFDGFAQGTEVMFQEPDFSGSTSGNLAAGSSSGADNLVSANPSCRFEFQFVDNTTTRWVRLTTFSATNQRNPSIRFDQGSVVSFRMRGRVGTCQEYLGSQGPGNAIADLCGPGLMSGQTSTYTVVDAPPSSLGYFAYSAPGQPNLPIVGGTILSGAGLIDAFVVFSDASGGYSLSVPGTVPLFDYILQSGFIDNSLPQQVTFTNAIQARFGQ